MHFLTSLIVVAVASQALALKYSDCGSKKGKVLEVHLNGCEESDVCELKRGETYSFTSKFESFTNSKTLKAVVHGVIGGIAMPYPIPNADACEHGGIDCPLESGKIYDYGNEIEVKKSYPSVRADVKWQMKDENNEDVACIMVPVKIV